MQLLLNVKGNKAAMIGWATLMLPFLFWIGLIVEKLFGYSTITAIFGSFSEVSPILLLMLILAVPAIGLVINAMAIINFNLDKTDDEFVGEFRIKAIPSNILVILLAGVNILLILGVAFADKFPTIIWNGSAM